MLGSFTVTQDGFLKDNVLPNKFYSTVCRILSVQVILPAQKTLGGVCVTLHLCGGITGRFKVLDLNSVTLL